MYRSFFITIFCALFMTVANISMAFSASYDCTKAQSDTEIAICNDFELSVDDRIISYLYHKHLSWRKGRDSWWSGKGELASATAIKDEQKSWLKNSRDACASDVLCIKRAMAFRIDELLDSVRLEAPRSGTRNRFTQQGKEYEKAALQFIGGIVENVNTTGMLPSLNARHSNPVVQGEPIIKPYGVPLIVWDNSNVHRVGKLLSENLSPYMQLKFGEYSVVDYKGLNSCLKGLDIKDFDWLGLDIYESSLARSVCISFSWPNGQVTQLPTIDSKFVTVDTDAYIHAKNLSVDTSSFRSEIESYLDDNRKVKLVYLDKFMQLIKSEATNFSDDILVSPNQRYILTSFGTRCGAKLFDIANKSFVTDLGIIDAGRMCFSIVGFSPDDALFYVYDEHWLSIQLYKTDNGMLVGTYQVASNPYIEGVTFTDNNMRITVHTSRDGEKIIDIDL